MRDRIAWVTPYLPEPRTSGGVLRIQELARRIAKHFELHLYARGEPWERRRLNSTELDMFSQRQLGRDWLPRGSTELPRRVRRGSPQSTLRRLLAQHRVKPYRALVLEHCWGAWGAFDLGIPTLLDEHNIESAYLADWFAARNSSPHTAAREVTAMQRWEQLAWRRAGAITCVSQDDADVIARVRATPPVVVANGTDTRSMAFHGAANRQQSVLFLGAMHHPPNAAAASRLVLRILPILWRDLPEVTVDVVGPAPPAELQALSDRRVRIHGRVPQVAPYLAQCGVFAFPLEHGAGSSLKTIEALAAGAPLVSTELGARGFGLVPTRHYLRAERDEDFAAALSSVLQAPQAHAEMTRSARARAEEFDWDVQAERFLHCLRSILTRPAGPYSEVRDLPRED